MRKLETLISELTELSQSIFSGIIPWSEHPEIHRFLDLCLIANEVEGICIYKYLPDRQGLGVHLRLIEDDTPVYGEIIKEILIDTHGNLWSKSKLKQLDEISTYYLETYDEDALFGACLRMAMVDLEYMYGLKRGAPIVQVCGPISTGPGNVEDKLIIFNKYIHTLTKKGHIVFNQMPYEPLFGLYHKHQKEIGKSSNSAILNKFYRPIIKSGYIQKGLFMHNYNNSEGARWQFELMSSLSIRTEIMPDDFIKNFWQERIPTLQIV